MTLRSYLVKNDWIIEKPQNLLPHRVSWDERRAVFASRVLTRGGWALTVGSFLIGAIVMLTSGQDKKGYNLFEGNLDPQLFDGLLILSIGTLSGLFLVMISSFVRAHLNSQTQLINLMRSQSNPELSPPT